MFVSCNHANTLKQRHALETMHLHVQTQRRFWDSPAAEKQGGAGSLQAGPLPTSESDPSTPRAVPAYTLQRYKMFLQVSQDITSSGGGPAIMVLRCATFSSASFSRSWTTASCEAAPGGSSLPPVCVIMDIYLDIR